MSVKLLSALLLIHFLTHLSLNFTSKYDFVALCYYAHLLLCIVKLGIASMHRWDNISNEMFKEPSSKNRLMCFPTIRMVLIVGKHMRLFLFVASDPCSTQSTGYKSHSESSPRSCHLHAPTAPYSTLSSLSFANFSPSSESALPGQVIILFHSF